MLRKKGVNSENLVNQSGFNSPDRSPRLARRTADMLGVSALVLAGVASCTATLARTEVTPLAGKETAITATEKRPPTITNIEKDDTIPMLVFEADVSTQVDITNAWKAHEGVPFADQINKGAGLVASEYTRTFNKNGGNPVIATFAASGESKVRTSLDAPRRNANDAGQETETVIELTVPQADVRISENRALKDDAFGGSVSPMAGGKKIIDVFGEIKAGEDITTDSESMRIMMDTTAKEMANQALIDKCLREDGPARDQLLKLSEDSLKKRMVKNFSQFNPNEPPITEHDVKVVWGKETDGEKRELVIRDSERDAFKENHRAFVSSLESKGFRVEQEQLMSDKGCQVSADATKVREAAK